MASSITWLHLSDLHACNPQTGWDANDVISDLNDDLVGLRHTHGLTPDLIFFTGDAGFGHLGNGRGQSLAAQLDEAEGFFRQVREACNVDKRRFFIVPGNHDVHRGLVNPSDTAWLDARIGRDDEDIVHLLKDHDTQWISMLARLGEYGAFLERYGYDHLLTDRRRLLFTCICQISGVNVGIAGFNTAWSCCRSPERGQLWWGGRWQVKALSRPLAECQVRIALTHHPSGWFTEAEDPVVDEMLKRRFDLRLHGHEHHGWIEQLSRVTETSDHLRISAGACYAASEKEKGYNFGRLDLSTGTVEVFLRRYDETGEGWVAQQLAHRTKSDGRWQSEPLRQFEPLRRLKQRHQREPLHPLVTPATHAPASQSARQESQAFAAGEARRKLLARLEEFEVDRLDQVRSVAAQLRPGQAIVVLAPRRTGSTAFTRQLQQHLRASHPDWEVPAVTVQPLAGEDERGYVERMRHLLGVESQGGRIVACIHGWSRGTIQHDFKKLDPYHAKLGGELRALLEGAGRRPFSIVAVGGYPLFLLRYGPADMSWLNIANEQSLPEGLSTEQVFQLMEKVDSGRWSALDAGEVCRRSGGHPLLVKKLIESWLTSPGMGWNGAEDALEDDRDFLLPTLARAMARPRLQQELERCCHSEDGVWIDSLNALAPGHYLYYEGLLRRNGRWWQPRCDVVRRLVLERMATRGGGS